MKTREQLEQDEQGRLAPYAQLASRSAGRAHPEPLPACQTAFQLDRARIVHSRAFRRLANKTQVFLSGTGDHLRTRLTHTMEVASVGRTIAAALGANEDLVECIALAHDLGHPPFGHSGEARLNRLLEDHGGFDHNLQSLRVVERLDTTFPGSPGLNLTHEVRESLERKIRPALRLQAGPPAVPASPNPPLEAQIADLADEIAYRCHDLEDGVDYGLIRPDQLAGLQIWEVCRDQSAAPSLEFGSRPSLLAAIRQLSAMEMADVVAESARRLEQAGACSAEAVRKAPGLLAGYSAPVAAANRKLSRFLHDNLYQHPAVSGPNERGCRMIEELFAAYSAEPGLMGAYFTEAGAQTPAPRIVCDYLSGMTDRFLESEHRRICGNR